MSQGFSTTESAAVGSVVLPSKLTSELITVIASRAASRLFSAEQRRQWFDNSITPAHPACQMSRFDYFARTAHDHHIYSVRWHTYGYPFYDHYYCTYRAPRSKESLLIAAYSILPQFSGESVEPAHILPTLSAYLTHFRILADAANIGAVDLILDNVEMQLKDISGRRPPGSACQLLIPTSDPVFMRSLSLRDHFVDTGAEHATTDYGPVRFFVKNYAQ